MSEKKTIPSPSLPPSKTKIPTERRREELNDKRFTSPPPPPKTKK